MTILNTAVDHHLSQLTTIEAQWFLNMYSTLDLQKPDGFLNLDSGVFNRLSSFTFVSEFSSYQKYTTLTKVNIELPCTNHLVIV